MADRRAEHPFRFVSCMELREALGKRALDEQRLLEIIEEAPADCIYYHTHSYFLRHPYAQRLFPNDFATWVTLHAQDRMLGEKLGVLDPFAFEDIEQLRSEIVTIITDHLRHIGTVPRCLTGEPFEFVRSHVIDVPLELAAATLQEFRDALMGVEVGAVYNHLCEARLRKGRLKGDFARWLAEEDGLRMPDLAEQVERVGHRGLSLEAMRERIVALCDQALAGEDHKER
ncbi:MAG: hypothetical protein HY444_05065 [Nitrospirae bacterium]|nr:hypothetical protein [Nitrospirota bacterium]